MKSKILRWIPVILWAAIIFLLSSMSAPPMPPMAFPLRDKIGHAVLYAGLAWLVARALWLHSRSLPKTLALAILLVSAYGASDEFHQQFVPYRTCDVMDWLADTIGAAIPLAGFYAYESQRNAKTKLPTAAAE